MYQAYFSLCFSLVPELVACLDVKDEQYDGVVVVTDCIDKLTGNLQCLKAPCEQYREVFH